MNTKISEKKKTHIIAFTFIDKYQMRQRDRSKNE